MLFNKKRSPSVRDAVVKKVLNEIEKMLVELEKEGKDLTRVKLKKYQKTHHMDCTCPKCSTAKTKKNPKLRGLREFGFKVYVAEQDQEDVYFEE